MRISTKVGSLCDQPTLEKKDIPEIALISVSQIDVPKKEKHNPHNS